MNLKQKTAVSLTAVVFCLAGCSSNKSTAELAPAAQSTPIPMQSSDKLPAPELKDVVAAVDRVFKGSAKLVSSHQPAFLAGDFNGDESQDLAVIISPAADRIAQMNEAMPPWLLRNPFGNVESTPRLRIAADDVLLAIIHGNGPQGWHDPEATQTFLLKNSVGSNMQTQTASAVKTKNEGKKQPLIRGDVISEVVQGQPGYLYYGTATYAWYNPATFTGEPAPTRGHGGMGRKTNQ
jgi:hypothetical protein